MSEAPGGKPNPGDRRQGDRPRRRNRRPKRGAGDSPAGREDRGRHRQRNRPRREKKPAPEKPATKPTTSLGQKLLRIVTFGLLGPGTVVKKPVPRRENAPKKPMEPVSPSDPGAVTGTRLHVGNLHYDIVESDLLDLFKGIGPVKSVDIVYNGHTHRSRGFGFVEFMVLADARRAVAELHGLPYMRRPLMLGPAKPRGEDEREADTPERGETE